MRIIAIHRFEDLIITMHGIIQGFAREIRQPEPMSKEASDSLGTLAINLRVLMIECQATAESIDHVCGVKP